MSQRILLRGNVIIRRVFIGEHEWQKVEWTKNGLVLILPRLKCLTHVCMPDISRKTDCQKSKKISVSQSIDWKQFRVRVRDNAGKHGIHGIGVIHPRSILPGPRPKNILDVTLCLCTDDAANNCIFFEQKE